MYTSKQLANALSMIDGIRRNPNSKATAIASITKRAAEYRLTFEQVMGCYDDKLDANEFLERIARLTQPKPRRYRNGTKEAKVIEMLQRPEGATIAQIQEVTEWQAHTIRGAFAGTIKRRGHTVTSTKVKGEERVYKIEG